MLPLDHADHWKVAWYCYREAAVVHKHRGSMNRLAWCYYKGQGVREDAAEAAVWFQKVADLGDLASVSTLGSFLVDGDARAGVMKDEGRGFALLCEAVEQGFGFCYCLPAPPYRGVRLGYEGTNQVIPRVAQRLTLSQQRQLGRWGWGGGMGGGGGGGGGGNPLRSRANSH